MNLTVNSILEFFAFSSIGLFVLLAVISRFQPGNRPGLLTSIAPITALLNIALVLGASSVVFLTDDVQINLWDIEQLGVSLRLDALSTIMWLMIALLSFIIIRFSINYLDGDARQGVFLGRLAGAIASVQLLVLAGNIALLWLAWVLTSIALHRLLLFYSNRPVAIVAARKKFVVARLSDLFLGVGFYFVYQDFGTGQLHDIFQAASQYTLGGLSDELEIAMMFLALAAIFKSALLPTHGWLIEVMETPTPVSALLHAGLLNAGPFLILRFSEVFTLSTYPSYLLIVIGGLTAIYGSVVYMTQTSIKTALSYSSIAHMGFSLMTCGLGAFPAAMLHLVGHSFYKAHCFLSSGSVIDQIRASYVALEKRSKSKVRSLLGILTAGICFWVALSVFNIGWSDQSPLFFLSLVIAMGLGRLLITGFDIGKSKFLFFRVLLTSLLVLCSFLLLEEASSVVLGNSVPEVTSLNVYEVVIISTLIALFLIGTILQVLSPYLKSNSWTYRWGVHLRNGLYINAFFDRMVRALAINSPENVAFDAVHHRQHLKHQLLNQLETQSQEAS